MPAFSQLVTTGSATYAAVTLPDVDMTARFVPDEYALIIEAPADGVAAFSFDGVNDAGRVKSGEPNETVAWRTKAQKVWVRKVAGAADVEVRFSVSTDV